MEGHEHEIDAVGLVRRICDDLYDETKDLSIEELIAIFRRRAVPASAQSEKKWHRGAHDEGEILEIFPGLRGMACNIVEAAGAATAGGLCARRKPGATNAAGGSMIEDVL